MARGVLLALALLATALSGCTSFGAFGGCSGAQAGGYQGGVCNTRDSFAYGVQGGKSGTETYSWENSGTRASVSFGFQGVGSAVVVLQDATGKQVFRQTFSSGQSGGSTMSQSGQAGTWRVTLEFVAFNGQGGLSISRA